ncbi:unnamed protein product, partial [Heterotrigona itama]
MIKQALILGGEEFEKLLTDFPSLGNLVQHEASFSFKSHKSILVYRSELFKELNAILMELIRGGTITLKNIDLEISEMTDTSTSSASIKPVSKTNKSLGNVLNSLEQADVYQQDVQENESQENSRIATQIESISELELKTMKNLLSLNNVLMEIQKHLTFVRSVFDRLCRRMSGERSLSSSAKARMDRGNGVGVGVGAGADDQGTANLRAGATLMKSVSIFLMSGRKASVNSNRQISVSPKHEQRRKHRRKMPVAGTARTSAHTVKLMELLKRKTRFSWQVKNTLDRSIVSSLIPGKSELDNLCKQYKNLINSGQQQVGQSAIVGRRTQSSQAIEGIDRVIFRELLHNTFKVITEDALVERIFCCWDRENEGVIRLEPWVMGLDLYLRGSLREKIEFCFKVYDLNNDGFITKDEIFQLFKNCLMKQPGEEDPDEAVKDLSELTLKKLDVDRDGKISFQDYKVAVTEEPLLLEAFGQCLSTDENCAAILASLRS